jgi:hypothetical protein
MAANSCPTDEWSDIVSEAYLAMKALDPDFATRTPARVWNDDTKTFDHPTPTTDTQNRAALRAKINDRFSKSLEYLSDGADSQSTDAVEREDLINRLQTMIGPDTTDGELMVLREAIAALTPNQSDNGEA